MQKTQKMLYIPICFKLEMHKTLQIPWLLNAKQKKHCKLQHVWQVDCKTCRYLHSWWNVKDNVERTKHSKLAVFWPLLDAETRVFTQFFARDSTKPLHIAQFLHFLNRLCQKKRWYLRVFQKIENRDVSETLKIMWYLRGFLPSDSAKCCKLQHFVRSLCSIS